jgi:hypothetical protein
MRDLRVRIMLVSLASALWLAACGDSLPIKKSIVDKIELQKIQDSPAWYGTRAIVVGSVYAAKVGFNGDNVYVLYYDAASRTLRIVKSPDRGLSWGSPYTVDNSANDYGFSNSIAVDNQSIYISYCRYSDSQVWFVKLTDTGSGFVASNAENIGAKLSSGPLGYENALAFDTTNVYLTYCHSSGAPMFTYWNKNPTGSFATPKQIDADLPYMSGSASHKAISIYAEGGYVNVAYYDDVHSQMKFGRFAVSSSLPLSYSTTVPFVKPIETKTAPAIVSVVSPSAVSDSLISYYDSTSKSYKLYEHYTYNGAWDPSYGYALEEVGDLVPIDAASSEVGRSGKLVASGTTLYSAYVDAANDSIKFAIGTKSSASTGYAFTAETIDKAGGPHYCCDVAHDVANSTFYVVYYNSTRGALMMAKSTDDGTTWTSPTS